MSENEVVKVAGFEVKAYKGGGFVVETFFDVPNMEPECYATDSVAKFKKRVKAILDELFVDNAKVK